MKTNRLIYTLFIALALVITSCGDDDEDSGGGIDADLVGTWTWSHDTYEDCDDSTYEGDYSISCTDDDCYQYVFTSGGAFTIIDTYEGEIEETSGTYETNGGNLTLSVSEDGSSFSVTYPYELIDDDTMELTLGDIGFFGCNNIETYTKED